MKNENSLKNTMNVINVPINSKNYNITYKETSYYIN